MQTTSIPSAQPSQDASRPKAAINWIILDEQFKHIGGSFDMVGTDGSGNGVLKTHDLSTIPAISIPKNGYIYVYCSNESQYNVFFDNLQVVHDRGAILEETHYYPFGLTMAGISSKTLTFGIPQNRYRYSSKELQNREFSDGSGLEWYDYGARMLDVQLGRWSVIDVLTEISRRWSPYNYAMNNPIRLIDPDGMAVTEVNGGYKFDGDDAIQAFTILQASNRSKEENDEDDEDDKLTGSVAAITFGKEKAWGVAMKMLVPEAILENVPAEKGQGGYSDFYKALKRISDQSPNGIGFLAVFSHGGSDNNTLRTTYGEGMIFANSELDPYADNVYTSDLSKLSQSVSAGDIKFSSYSIIYLGGCNSATPYKNGKSFAMEMAKATGSFVYAAANEHMDPASKDYFNTKFRCRQGGQLTISYWPSWASQGTSVVAKEQIIDVAAKARWYLNIGL